MSKKWLEKDGVSLTICHWLGFLKLPIKGNKTY